MQTISYVILAIQIKYSEFFVSENCHQVLQLVDSRGAKLYTDLLIAVLFFSSLCFFCSYQVICL